MPWLSRRGQACTGPASQHHSVREDRVAHRSLEAGPAGSKHHAACPGQRGARQESRCCEAPSGLSPPPEEQEWLLPGSFIATAKENSSHASGRYTCREAQAGAGGSVTHTSEPKTSCGCAQRANPVGPGVCRNHHEAKRYHPAITGGMNFPHDSVSCKPHTPFKLCPQTQEDSSHC